METAVEYTKKIIEENKRKEAAALKRASEQKSEAEQEMESKRRIIEFVLPLVDGYKDLGWEIEVWTDKIELTKVRHEKENSRTVKVVIKAKGHYNSWVNGGHDGIDYYIEWSCEDSKKSICYNRYFELHNERHHFAKEFGKFMADYC